MIFFAEKLLSLVDESFWSKKFVINLPFARINITHYIVYIVIRGTPQGADFPHKNTKRPNI